MMIVTAKLSKPKLLGIVCAAAAVVILMIVLSARGAMAQHTFGAKNKLETPESRVEFLLTQGYQVSQEPVRVQEVKIPEEFTEVYEAYNAIQKAQGMDLSRYRGKRVTQYVYAVENYPEAGSEPVYATMLLYKNKLIGADLSRGGSESFLRPLLSA